MRADARGVGAHRFAFGAAGELERGEGEAAGAGFPDPRRLFFSNHDHRRPSPVVKSCYTSAHQFSGEISTGDMASANERRLQNPETVCKSKPSDFPVAE